MWKNKNFAIFWWSALWDSIVITPLLKNIKKYFPESKIYYITGSLIGIHQLSNCPHIDKLISIKNMNIRKIIKICRNLLLGNIWYTFTNFVTLQTFMLSRFCRQSKQCTIDSKGTNRFDKYYDHLIPLGENIVRQPEQFIAYAKQENQIAFDDALEIWLPYQEQESAIKKILAEYAQKKRKNNRSPSLRTREMKNKREKSKMPRKW